MKRKIEISVIVPVLNEGDSIREFLLHVRETAANVPVEIIVVDCDPEESTIQKISSGDAVTLRSRPGRGAQMNRGAAEARGEIFVFLHADTRLPENAFTLINKALEKSGCAGGAFDLGIDSRRFLMLLTARCASLKHRITRVPYGDQAIFIRAGFFREIGGYKEVPIFEDVELMRRIKKLGKKITILNRRTKTSPRKWEKDGAFYAIVRNWTLQALYLMGASPEFLAKHYYGEKHS
jgi:rSAM/selenodomain-associated transferase 2